MANSGGDHIVTLVVQVPRKLNAQQKEALKAFDEAMGGSLNEATSDDKDSQGKDKKKKSFFDKLK